GAGGGAGGGQSGGGEPSDASGLLDATTDAWSGDFDQDLGEPSAAFGEGADRLVLPDSGEGSSAVPMAPVVPPFVPAPPGERARTAEESSTSSRLADGEDAAWTDTTADDPAELGTSDTPFAPGVGAGAEGSPPSRGWGEAAEAALWAQAALISRSAAEQAAERRRSRDEDEEDGAAFFPASVPASFAADPELPAPPAGSAGQASEDAFALDGIPDAEVALTPGEAAAETEDFAAWDVVEDPLIPLLRSSAATDEEEEEGGPASRYSGEEEETWTGERETPGAPAPSMATWQPDRSGTGPSSTTVQAQVFSSWAEPDPDDLPEAEQAPQLGDAEDQEEAEEEQADRRIARLLVQHQDAWGSLEGEDDLL
ncbi:hypothetical protein ACWD5V_41030, partial [Streptomyces sp. NPDC002523]